MTRPFPRHCGKCGQTSMRLANVPYVATINMMASLAKSIFRHCRCHSLHNCQSISIDDEADREISAAFRRAARLLEPEEIRQGRERLG